MAEKRHVLDDISAEHVATQNMGFPDAGGIKIHYPDVVRCIL